MSILDGRKNNFLHVVAGIFKKVGAFLAILYYFSAQAIAGCGAIDITQFPSGTYKFVDGGYKGFVAKGSQDMANCYAASLTQNGMVGIGMLDALSKGVTTSTIDKFRGLPQRGNSLLVAHRGGPDWANGIPDNSVEAFRQSINRGVSSVEVDVQMDSGRNLIAYHDASFADMVKPDANYNLQNDVNRAISASEWISTTEDNTLDDWKLRLLSRVIPNAFSLDGIRDNMTYLRLQSGATISPTAKVSSLDNILNSIQDASKTKFNSKAAVNIFIDAAKSKDITIATINKLRRYQLIARDKIYNNTKYLAPSISSIAIQFKIKDFPLGVVDLKNALCASAENKIRYIKTVVVVRSLYANLGVQRTYKESTITSYEDNMRKNIYRQTSTFKYFDSYSPMKTGTISVNQYPIQLWGDAASRTCYIDSDFIGSGIALVPVVEEVLPYGVSINSSNMPRNIKSASEAVSGINDYLYAFKKDFIIDIIEFSYTPMDKFSYYPSVSPGDPVPTDINSTAVYKEFADKVLNTGSGKKFIYQTFNRFFDITVAGAIDSTYNGQYLCSSQIINTDFAYYGYLCNTQAAASTDEQKFEYRSKPGFYSGICNNVAGSPFTAIPFGLTTTDNPLLEIYLNDTNFFANVDQVSDFCTVRNADNRMSDYTTRYKSFVGNPSFRLSGGI